MKKEIHHRGFWKKIRFKYKLSAINENTLEEVASIRTSIFSGAIIFLGIAFLLITLTSVIIITTPIRYYLPGYLDTEVRDQAVRAAIRIDSLEQSLRYQNAYINNIRQVLSEEIPVDLLSRVDSVYIAENDPMLEKSDLEKEFVTKYEEEEKYTLGIFSSKRLPDNVILYKPIEGVVVKHFDEYAKEYGIVVQAAKKENVLSVLEGTVITSGYDIVDKYFIHIQHKNGYVSVYKGLTSLTKKSGDAVKTNEAIGVIATEKKTNGNKVEEVGGTLTFELWNKGIAINPETHITF